MQSNQIIHEVWHCTKRLVAEPCSKLYWQRKCNVRKVTSNINIAMYPAILPATLLFLYMCTPMYVAINISLEWFVWILKDNSWVENGLTLNHSLSPTISRWETAQLAADSPFCIPNVQPNNVVERVFCFRGRNVAVWILRFPILCRLAGIFGESFSRVSDGDVEQQRITAVSIEK